MRCACQARVLLEYQHASVASHGATLQAGGFYHCTSNADAHSYDFFEPSEIMEVHGNIETWQCGNNCTPHLWRLPGDVGFQIDKST